MAVLCFIINRKELLYVYVYTFSHLKLIIEPSLVDTNFGGYFNNEGGSLDSKSLGSTAVQHGKWFNKIFNSPKKQLVYGKYFTLPSDV